MIEFLKSLALALLPVPQKGETEDAALFKWRQAVALSIILIGGGLVLSVVIATGYLSFMGLSGFALASDVQVLIQQGKDTRVQQIENAITQDRTLQCQAIMEGNQSAMNYAYFHLQGDVDQYTSIPPHMIPRIPSCDELIPAASGVRAPTPTPSAASMQQTAK